MFFKKSERYKKYLEKYKNFSGYEDAWIENKKFWLEHIEIQPPLFPILLCYEIEGQAAITKFESFENIFEPDYIGYKWEKEEYIIDSNGYKYEVDYIDMYHPVGFVYPSKITKRFNLQEFIPLIENYVKKEYNLNLYNEISIKDIIEKL